METYIRATEAAKILGLTKQGMHLAAKFGQINLIDIDKFLHVSRSDLEKYAAKRGNKTRYRQSLAYKKGLHGDWRNVTDAMQLTGLSRHKIYRAIGAGLLKAQKIGSSYVFKVGDLERFQSTMIKTGGKVTEKM